MVRGNISWILICAVFATTSGCFKPESPHLIEDTFSIELQLDNGVSAQYVNLTNRKIIHAIAPIPWHVKFACNDGDFRVEINSAAGIAGHRINNLTYNEVDNSYPVDKIIWDYDLPGQSLESTVIGAWGDFSFNQPKSLKDVIVLNIPINADELIVKLQIMGVVDGKYQVQTSLLDNSVRDTFYVNRNTYSNYRYINLLERIDVEFEPASADWDLVFTRFVDTTMENMTSNNPFALMLNSYLSVYPGLLANTSEIVWSANDQLVNMDSIHFQMVQGRSYKKQTSLLDAQSMILTQEKKPTLPGQPGFFIKKRQENRFFYVRIDEYHIETTGKSRVALTIKSL